MKTINYDVILSTLKAHKDIKPLLKKREEIIKDKVSYNFNLTFFSKEIKATKDFSYLKEIEKIEKEIIKKSNEIIQKIT